MTRLARLAYETIKDLLQTAVGTRTAIPGAVACLQSAGNLLDWHPHVHLLVSWGLFRRDGCFISDAVHPRHQANFRVFDPLDCLAEVSAHIPSAHEETTLF